MKAKLISEGLRDKLVGPTEESIKNDLKTKDIINIYKGFIKYKKPYFYDAIIERINELNDIIICLNLYTYKKDEKVVMRLYELSQTADINDVMKVYSTIEEPYDSNVLKILENRLSEFDTDELLELMRITDDNKYFEMVDKINQYDADDLYDLYYRTDKKFFLEKALERGDISKSVGDKEVGDILYNYPDLKDKMFPYVVKNFPYTLKQEGEDYYLIFEEWTEFMDLFKDSRDTSKKFIESILSGEIYNYGNYSHTITDISGWFKKPNETLDKLRNKVKETLENNEDDVDYEEYNNLKTIDDIINVITEYDSLDDIKHAMKMAFNNAYESAEISEAYEHITDAILNFFGCDKKDIVHEDGSMKLKLSKDNIIKILLTCTDVDDKLNYSSPYNEYYVDMKDYEEEFYDELDYRLDEIN